MAAMPRHLLTAGFLAAGFVLVAAVVLMAVFVLGQNRLLYFPTRAFAATPATLGLRADDLAVVAEDGVRLEGWRIRGDGTRALLFFHGNAGNVADRLERAKMLNARFGFDIFLVDYRGYGRSRGSPSEEGLYRDARAVYAAAASAGFRPEQIVIFGESLGAAVAVDLAGNRACAGLVLEAPFLSIPAVARVHYPFVPSFFVRSRFDNRSKISAIPAPKLILVPELDEIVPPDHGRRLFDAANGVRELYVVPGARHNDAYVVGGEAYWSAWERFLSSLPSGRGPG